MYKIPVIGFIVSTVVVAAAIADLVWWQLAHNFINVSCTNFIYHAHHLQQCATWNMASGIRLGVTMPLIIIGFLGMMGCGIWFAFRYQDAH